MPRKSSSNTEATTLKLPQEVIGRADKLLEQINADPMRLGYATRTDVLRVAIMLGLRELENRGSQE